MPLKYLNAMAALLMMFFTLLILSFSGVLEFPSVSTSIRQPIDPDPNLPDSEDVGNNSFTDIFGAFSQWDSQVGCARFREKHRVLIRVNVSSGSLQESGGGSGCNKLKMDHVRVLVKGWTWIPDNLENLYSCRCGMTCLWTKSPVMVDKPDALLFETTTPPLQRRIGDPLRVYMDLEAGRRRSGREDIFISYHAEDDVQSTYAGALFHNNRNYHVSPHKNSDVLVYWSSSRCLAHRDKLAKSLLDLLPHHSFGKCLNNVGGSDAALSMYPECIAESNAEPKWYDHLHCAMSHYKFVLAIENTATDSYVTEKLFYALDSGAVPIYFGAPNAEDFVPPHSVIDGTKFRTMEELAEYVKRVGDDPVAYAEYHAWRRCGLLGNYGGARALSLDTLPCRLCEDVSRRGGRKARA
ncbi:PREDICTED: alpha-(1,4)-fucosyltransferase isoform X2 [Tarenaya hassleriana]|uniref:alpha-(1,4)-fucosyltransferase isoform X2 n=1 Tax=Tarenaya hassleriana TaxID=28532 RepID=UPI00053C3321|nr:PREDICTED: alpha-(1,4)-fucosyltransferase isoform X2 [Tarenaya hassleriana]